MCPPPNYTCINLIKLHKVLAEKRKNKKYKLIVINFGNEIKIDKKESNIEIINTEWTFGADWGNEIYNTKSGQIFFEQITQELNKIIKQDENNINFTLIK